VPVYELNPLADPRWEEFLERHPQTSVFHTRVAGGAAADLRL